MLGAPLVGFLIFALLVLVVAYVVIYVIDQVPSIPAPARNIAKLIVGLIAFLAILQRAAIAFGVTI